MYSDQAIAKEETAMIMTSSIKPKQLRRLGQGVFWSALVLALWLARQPLFEMLSLLKDREAVITYLQGYGAWGPILLTAIIVLQVLVATIPGHVFMIAGGYVYGFTVAFLITLISTVATSQLTFALARAFGRPIVYRLAPPKLINHWEKIADRQGGVFFLFAFILPIFPSDLMSYVAGLSSISPKRFLMANFLGRLPCAALMALIGSHGLEWPIQVWIPIVLASASMFLVWRYCSTKLDERYAQQLKEV
jgi:uncharacterized membrane protein YdjX (TVP38/TMEM64 family)